MKTTAFAAALAFGLGLALYAPQPAQAAGAAGAAALPMTAQKDASLTQQVHWRGRRWGRGWGGWGYGPSIYFGAPGFYGYYGGYRPRRYYRTYSYGPGYYRPYYRHRYYRW